MPAGGFFFKKKKQDGTRVWLLFSVRDYRLFAVRVAAGQEVVSSVGVQLGRTLDIRFTNDPTANQSSCSIRFRWIHALYVYQ